METNYIAEAFQKLSLLEDDFNFSVGPEAADDLKSYIADDVDVPTEEPIIDVAAETADDLQDTYVGKVILECSCCHTRIYKDLAEVFIDDETGFANPDEDCPVCHTKSGYNVIGKIEEFVHAEETIEEEPEEEPVETNDEFSEEELAEAFRGLKEGYKRSTFKDTDDVPMNEDITEVEVKTREGSAKVKAEEAGKVTVDLTEENAIPDNDGETIVPLDIDDEDVIETNEAPEEGEIGDGADIPEEPIEDTPIEDIPEEGTEDISAEEEIPEDEELPEDEEVEESLHEGLGISAEEFKKRILAKFGGNDIKESAEEEPLEEDREDKETFIQRLRRKYGAELGEAKSTDAAIDQLVEGYLRKVYGNVSNYHTTSIKSNKGLIAEGVISFNSGKQKTTKFIFEDKEVSANGSVIYKGMNETFSNAKHAFTLKGSEVENKFIPESMIYRYSTKTLNESNESETIKVSGRVVVR